MTNQIVREEHRADGIYLATYSEVSAVKQNENFVDVRGWIDQILSPAIPNNAVRVEKVNAITDMLRQEGRLITAPESQYLVDNFW